MCAKWNPDIDRDVVIASISRIASVNEDGNASFGIPGVFQYIPILISALEFDPNVPRSLHHGLVSSAVSGAVKEGKLDADNVKRLVTARERAYPKEPLKRYVLLTDIGVKLPKYPLRIGIEGTTLFFTEQYPERFDRKPIAHRFSRAVPAKFPNNYCWVRVSLSDRGPREAGERAVDTLDLLRGIWNLGLTFQSSRLSSPARGPANKIILGPIHTLHSPSGALATKVYWYEPSYRIPVKPHDASGKFDNLRRFEGRIRRQLKAAKERLLLTRALIRYVRAQDEYELDNMFLRLWSVLETLTDTLKLPYDKTIRRAAFIWKDRALAMQELKHLRVWRNRSVHLGESSDNKESHVYSLKAYVDRLLAFLLLNPENRKQSLAEIARFLDLPYDVEALTKAIGLHRKALKLHGGKP